MLLCPSLECDLTSIAQESAWIHACKGSALSLTGAPSLGMNGEKTIGTQADPRFHTVESLTLKVIRLILSKLMNSMPV